MQEKKFKANAALATRKQKPVTKNPLKKTHSANNIVHNDVNIADLLKQISYLNAIVCTHVLKNKKEESFSRDVITVQNQKLKIHQSFYPYQA